MTLRIATIKDASSIAALSVEVWLGTYLRHGINGFFADYVLSEFTTDNIVRHLTTASEHFIVSQNAEGIDGFIRISSGARAPVDGGGETEIATFYVQPRHHGKGIGSKLLNAAVERSAATGVQSLWLTTNAENAPAIAFYLRRGFRQIGQTQFRLHDQAYLNNVYALDVGQG